MRILKYFLKAEIKPKPARAWANSTTHYRENYYGG